jgi:hypothetical protein
MAELDLSYREATLRSDGLISHGHLNQIARGFVRAESIGSRAVKGIALSIDVPLSKVEKAVKDSKEDPNRVELVLPKKAQKLTSAEWKALMAFLDTLLQNHAK